MVASSALCGIAVSVGFVEKLGTLSSTGLHIKSVERRIGCRCGGFIFNQCDRSVLTCFPESAGRSSRGITDLDGHGCRLSNNRLAPFRTNLRFELLKI